VLELRQTPCLQQALELVYDDNARFNSREELEEVPEAAHARRVGQSQLRQQLLHQIPQGELPLLVVDAEVHLSPLPEEARDEVGLPYTPPPVDQNHLGRPAAVSLLEDPELLPVDKEYTPKYNTPEYKALPLKARPAAATVL